MSKPPGKCVFCSGIGLTKEHVFSDWLKKLIPKTADQSDMFAGMHFNARASEFGFHNPPQIRRRQGSSQQRKKRIVCLKCNIGWMSETVE